LKSALLPPGQWRPFPTAQDRRFWQGLPDEVRKAHIARGEEALGRPWPSLPATLILKWRRGDISSTEADYRRPQLARRQILADLVLAECTEGKGRFLNGIVDAIWSICEESSWLQASEMGGLPDGERPRVTIRSADTTGYLVWSIYLLNEELDRISSQIRARVVREIDKRVLTPYLKEDANWMGFEGGRERPNNWNPWSNSEVLAATMLLEPDTERRLDIVERILKCLDRFLDPYPSDGACDEGPSYWGHAGASLLDCLELLYGASEGKIDFYGQPLVQEIGRFISRAHIHDNYFFNFGDAPARVSVLPISAFLYGKRIGDQELASFGAYFVKRQPQSDLTSSASLGRRLLTLLHLSDMLATPASAPLHRDVFLGEELHLMAARSRTGSSEGLYLAALGAHNGQSHNHSDVGNFVLYADGQPVIVDAGVETYSGRTFSSDRYQLWTMQSAYHNLPTINGYMQAAGRGFAARNVSYKADDAMAELNMDIAKAYPAEAGVESWTRTIRLNRGVDAVVRDSYHLTMAARELSLSLMTPCEVRPAGPGTIILSRSSAGSEQGQTLVRLEYPADKLRPSFETIQLKDATLRSIWGERLHRIVLRGTSSKAEDSWSLRFEAAEEHRRTSRKEATNNE